MSERKSVSASLEAEILKTLRDLVPGVPAVGFLETAAAGEMKVQDPTAIQVKVDNFTQPLEAYEYYQVAAEIRVNVEQAESADAAIFLLAHERIALWLEWAMVGANCAALDTAEAHVDGLQRTGDSKGFDTTTGEWFVAWTMTLKGRIKKENNNG